MAIHVARRRAYGKAPTADTAVQEDLFPHTVARRARAAPRSSAPANTNTPLTAEARAERKKRAERAHALVVYFAQCDAGCANRRTWRAREGKPAPNTERTPAHLHRQPAASGVPSPRQPCR